MIIRARPKYLAGIDLFENWSTGTESEFFFSSGRAALKFLLIWLSREKSRQVIIGMQAFNCKVVLDAALEANCKVVLSDIGLKCFSITLNSVKKMVHQKKIDVLILTHYQGIPNEEYEQIISYCKKKHVWVIEDVSQSYGSSTNGFEIGTLGNVALNSFAFDKPFTCMFGGSLKFNAKTTLIFKDFFEQLPNESTDEAELHLKILAFLWEYTAADKYKVGIDTYNAIGFLKGLKLSNRSVYSILNLGLIIKVITKLFSLGAKLNSNNEINIKKLHPMKIGLIRRQAAKFVYDPKKVETFIQLCNEKSIAYPKFDNSVIKWNRFSLLDKSSVLKNELKQRGYQVSNYNWPITLDKLTKSSKVIVLDNLDNSEFASKNILNIPVWK